MTNKPCFSLPLRTLLYGRTPRIYTVNSNYATTLREACPARIRSSDTSDSPAPNMP